MATTPMMEDEQPTDFQDSEMGEDEYSGFEICIRCEADGKLSVGVEEDSTPQTEGLEGDEDKSSYKPAENIREALTMALEIYRERMGKAEEETSEDSFNTAFKQTRGDMGGMQ